MPNTLRLACLLASLWAAPALAHDISVDNPFTPQVEVAGVDTPPFDLAAVFNGPLSQPLFAADCRLMKLTTLTIGAWQDLDPAGKQAFVNCVAMMMTPENLSGFYDVQGKLPEVDEAVSNAVGLLVDLHRPPYNLSAAEVISGDLVVFGMATPASRRPFLRAIMQEYDQQ